MSIKHSITFVKDKHLEKNSWSDWYLIPSSRPVFSPPSPKLKFVDIPGMAGQLDISTVLTNGYPIYENRSGDLEFVFAVEDHNLWISTFDEMMIFFKDSNIQAILEDDPDYYYEGLFNLTTWRSEKKYSMVVISYNVNPYKKIRFTEGENWLWDPFDFEDGIISDYYNVELADPLVPVVLPIIGGAQRIIPIFRVTGTASVIFKDVIYVLNSEKVIIPDIVIEQGVNVLTFLGEGSVTVEYREGSL